ncbi:MAG: MiaB/RimO family radical SAM methylthiotransferase [Acidobacteriota bacterium]
MTYAVVTFGCRVNQADSLAAEEALLGQGATATAPEQADVVIVNTCSVTASADQAARQTIRRLARVNPGARIVVTGCYATRRPDELAALHGVAAVVPNDDKPALLQMLARPPVDDGDGACGARIEPGVAGRTAFTLRVQTGCGEQCSYCVIPTTRGRPRSVPIDILLAEVARVVDAGFKEIALTGVHLGSYGRDLEPPSSLAGLMHALAGWIRSRRAASRQADVLFRVSSLEPMDCSPAVVDLVAGAGCFAPHLHLPLQHASDRVLAAMRRPYTIDYYRRLVDAIRRRMPHASIGSDVLVGFPGETEEDFAELAAYLAGCPLTHLHVFPYSDRPGTSASAMAGKVHGTAVRERARVVRDIGQRLTARFRAAQLGTVHRGLTIEDGALVVTGNYLKVQIPPGAARNEWVDVRVTGADGVMRGELCLPVATRH